MDTRPFFGGLSIISETAQFAIIMGEQLYFKVNDTTRPSYIKLGLRPFSYATRNGVREVHAYYQAPPRALTEAALLERLAVKAIKAAKK